MAQIDKPNLHFNTVLYTGNGQNSRAITGVGFQPDWAWLKYRNNTYSHQTFDRVRGASPGTLYTDLTNAVDTNYPISSFDSDGITLRATSDASQNANSGNFVLWSWKANGAGSSNGNGSVTSTVSANTTAGFSIVKWTGTGATATVGHGLGAKPSIVLIKNTGATENWVMYHSALGAEKNLKLNNHEAAQDTTGAFNDTEPTTSVFTVHTNTNTNQSGQVMIAYCFTEKTGYSKFGKYEGNGNADGVFIYTGFKPAFVLIKNSTDAGELWEMFDNRRIGYNPNNYRLYPSDNTAEDTSLRIDLVSNGFKLRTNGSHINESGDTMVYWAFAENPIVGSNNIPAVAK